MAEASGQYPLMASFRLPSRAGIGGKGPMLAGKDGFDRAIFLLVSLDKGESQALIPKGAGLASRLSSTRIDVAVPSAHDDRGSWPLPLVKLVLPRAGRATLIR